MRGWKISTYPVFQISMQDHRRQEWQTHTTLSNFCTVSQNEISKDNGKKRPLPLYPYTSKFPQQELRVSEEDTTQLLLHMVWQTSVLGMGFIQVKRWTSLFSIDFLLFSVEDPDRIWLFHYVCCWCLYTLAKWIQTGTSNGSRNVQYYSNTKCLMS